MKKTIVTEILVLILVLPITLFSQPLSLLEEIKDHQDGLALWWNGHNGWIIKSGELVISTDILPDYRLRAIPTSISADELAEVLDISFVTHGHNDHFNREASRILAEKGHCIFVIPQSCLSIAAEIGIPNDRIIVASPRMPFDIEGVRVEPLRAIHGNANFAIYYDANLQDCGYVLDVDGTRFLQPGDSYLLEDHLFLEYIDVLFFSPTEHNMYIDRSVILINHLEPTYIFPQHHSTVIVNEETRFWAKGYPHEVKLRLSTSLQARYHIPVQGRKILIR